MKIIYSAKKVTVLNLYASKLPQNDELFEKNFVVTFIKIIICQTLINLREKSNQESTFPDKLLNNHEILFALRDLN